MMESIGLDWRAGIFLLLGIAVIYLVAMLRRLANIARRRPLGGEVDLLREPLSSRDIAAAPSAAVSPAPTFGAAANRPDPITGPAFEWAEVKDLFSETTASATVSEPPATPLATPAGGFGEHLAEHLARAELEMEVQRMRAEIGRMRAEMDELRMARRVSPQYAEAMELAQRGLPAQAVADRLGISLAEAELVHALSRGDKNFAEGDEHGADGYAPHDGPSELDNRRSG
jgi:hypothetical protein